VGHLPHRRIPWVRSLPQYAHCLSPSESIIRISVPHVQNVLNYNPQRILTYTGDYIIFTCMYFVTSLVQSL
jgi:hypothetical protein